MRTRFSDSMDSLAADLATMCGLAETAIAQATESLLDADLSLAEQVITAHADIEAAATDWQHRAFALLALEAPLARDLRFTVAGIHIVADLERMDGLAVHIAQIARRRHPRRVVPDEVRGVFAEMGGAPVAAATGTRFALQHRDPERARRLLDADDTMDELRRSLYTLTQGQEWPHGVEAAVDVTLLGRFYERFADHTVEIGRRILFRETGNRPT